MKSYVINGGKPLYGEVIINGSKNAALPVLAAALLTENECRIHNVPDLLDIKNMCELLSCLGCMIDNHNGVYSIHCKNLQSDVMSYETVNKLRASFLVAGPLLARTGRVRISLPGGCQIGARPVDLHLKGFKAMGAEIEKGHGFVEAVCEKLKGADIYLDFPSVGATENLIMAASLAKGTTVIENAAAEPEIANLAEFINSMGGDVSGAGTDTVRINGVESLCGVSHTVIPDRIEAGTFAFAAAATHGSVVIKNVITDHLKPVIAKLEECGISTEVNAERLIVNASKRAKAADIKTMPYPGFPTDLQPQIVVLLTTVNGQSTVTEGVWDNRFQYVSELSKLGANINVEGKKAVINGGTPLIPGEVEATDLRAGASMVIAALSSNGTTKISQLRHIDRGYDHIVDKLRGLGADIERIDE